MKIKDQIREKFESAGDPQLILLNTSSENYFEAVMESTKFMLKEGEGIYFTASRPYRYISKEMQRRKIKTDDLVFIDCISIMAGEHSNGDCIFVENPAALEEISMYIDSMLDKMEGSKKFLVMDSLSTLLIYNSQASVKEFSMFLMNKLRIHGVGGVFVVLERELPKDIKQILIAMCDKTVQI